MKSIFNNNEYFSDHYLNASLAGDCKELLDKWTAAAKQANAGLSGAAAKARTPNEQLKGDKGLRSKWERARAESFSEDTVGAWAHALLTVLGSCFAHGAGLFPAGTESDNSSRWQG